MAQPPSCQGNDHCDGNNRISEHNVAPSGSYCFRVSAVSYFKFLPVLKSVCRNIGWKFYLCFIIPGYIFAVCAWLFFPDTRHLALEEIAAIFGDADEIYHVQDVTKLSLEMNGKSEHQEDV